MKKIWKSGIAIAALGLATHTSLFAQDTIRNKEDGNYFFKVVKDIEATDVKNQYRSGTCWSFSTLSFFESELKRMGKGDFDLSEMYVVRNTYSDKAKRYVRMNGYLNFGPGGAFHDVTYVIKNYGMVPESVYSGLNYGTEKHEHNEMDHMLKAMVDAVIKNPNKTLTKAWHNAFDAALESYLGEVPAEFEFNGKNYTPKTYAEEMGINPDDYVEISSYMHHPYYEQFILEVPDNWLNSTVYNVPLNELTEIMDNAIMNGYGIAWAADVSEKGFSYRNGLAIVPQDMDAIKKKGKDNKHFSNAGAQKSGNQFDSPGPELEITPELRQEAYDNYQTTDDHGMHITGIVKDQNGTEYYIVKNSWGTDNNDNDGYFFASKAYVKYKTMDIMVHKDAIPKAIKKKLGIK